jgi:hypothetical protein
MVVQIHDWQSVKITSNAYMDFNAVQGITLVVLDDAKASSKELWTG